MITPLQKKAFFKLFARACDVQGIPAHRKESYRHSLIEKAVPTSKGSLKAVNTGSAFDRLMLALAHEAQDAEAVEKYSVAEGNRLAKMAEALVWQIWQIQSGLSTRERKAESGDTCTLKPVGMAGKTLLTTAVLSEREPNSALAGASAPVAYISGILRQAHFPHLPYLTAEGWWLDCTIDHLQKLLQMLDIHRRRLLRQWDAKLEWCPKLKTYVKMRVYFQMDAIYEWHGEILYKRTPEISHGVPTPRQPLIHVRAYSNEQ